MLKSDWSATDFFQNLIAKNKLANTNQFVFCKVSGLEGFEEALHAMQSAKAFCCVSDISDGYTELNNTPRTRRIKTVFIAMRHAIDDMDARNECMEIMRELFRQLMSRLIHEKVKLEQNFIYIDPRISFNEIDRYFFSGCACAYFQIAVDCFTDLCHRSREWTDDYLDAPYDYITKFNLWLIETTQTIKVVKILMNLFGYNLSKAKKLVENRPCVVGSGSKTEMEEAAAALKELATTKILQDGQIY